MPYRVFVLLIVAFWLAMSALLVRQEWGAARGAGQPVPLAHVWRLVFSHEEPSNLVLTGGGGRARLGSLHVQPGRLVADPAGKNPAMNQLSVIGNFSLTLPGLPPQSVVLHAVGRFGPDDRLARLESSVQLREGKSRAPGTVAEVDGQPAADQWHYAVRQGGALVQEDAGSAAALLDNPALRAAGLDPALLLQMGRRAAAEAAVSARRGSLRLNGEEVETFVVTFRQGEGVEWTVHVNPLGQILAVRTPLGYDLSDEAFAP